jgi:hypothetical protein
MQRIVVSPEKLDGPPGHRAANRQVTSPQMPPRIAYLITSYTLPHQIVRLASVLRGGSSRASIVVHHDTRRCNIDRAQLRSLDVEFVEPPSVVEWGEFSQLAMILRCFQWLLSHTEFEWVILLSGQDYPVRPISEIERWIAHGEVDARIELVRCDPPPFRRSIDEFAARYYYRWQRLPAVIPTRFARAAATGRPLVRSRVMGDRVWIGLPRLHSLLGPELVCYHGSDWFALSRRAVEVVERLIQARPEVLRFYRHALIPTESLVHTAVANCGGLRLSGDHGRYYVFDEHHRARPRILRMPDLDAVLSSGAYFARKFDETVDEAVLDEIDRRVHSSHVASHGET